MFINHLEILDIMKSFRNILPLFGLALAMAEAGAAASAAAPAATGVPSTNDAAAAPKTRAPKNPDNILDIINGRMPTPLVSLIRFKITGTNAERAKLFGTSVGKVFDIVKGRNFGYIDAEFKFTKEELDAAKAWMTALKTKRTEKTLVELNGAEKVGEITKLLDAMTVASAEDVAKRPATRVVGQPAAAGTAPVAAGGTAAAPAVAAEKPAGGGKMFGGAGKTATT